MRHHSRWILAALAAAFALGMAADDIVKAKRFQVFTADGKPAVTITEAGGNGQIIVFNDKGEEVWAVKSGKVVDRRADSMEQRLATLEGKYADAKRESDQTRKDSDQRAEDAQKNAAPSKSSTTEADTAKSERLKLLEDRVKGMMDGGVIHKVDFNNLEAQVNPAAWASVDADTKKTFTIVLAEYIQLKRNATSKSVSIVDSKSGKELASYSDLWGYSVK